MVSLRRSTDSGGGIGYVSPFITFKETNAPADPHNFTQIGLLLIILPVFFL